MYILPVDIMEEYQIESIVEMYQKDVLNRVIIDESTVQQLSDGLESVLKKKTKKEN